MKRTFLLLGLLLLLILLLELGLRYSGLAGAPLPPGEFDSRLGWSLSPGGTYRSTQGAQQVVKIDSRGFRSGPTGEGKTGLPVLFLGGEAALGFGCAWTDTAGSTLARLLGDRKLTIKPLAGGGPGYSLDQQLLWFRQRGAPLRPALVILVVDQLAVMRLNQGRWGRLPKPCFSRAGAGGGGPTNLPLQRPAPPGLALWQLLAGLGSPPAIAVAGGRIEAPYAVLAREQTPQVALAWNKAEYLLGRMKAEVQAAGGLMLACSLLEPFQLDGARAHQLVSRWGVQMDDIYIDQALRRLVEICRRLEINWVETRDHFRGAAKRGLKMHRPGSRLPRPEAQTMLGTLLAQRLVELGWHGLGR